MMSGRSFYTIVYAERVSKKDIPKLSAPVKRRIRTAIEQKLTLDPLHFGKPLKYSFQGHHRLRVGDYRVIYRIDPQAATVYVVAIRHRKDVYE